MRQPVLAGACSGAQYATPNAHTAAAAATASQPATPPPPFCPHPIYHRSLLRRVSNLLEPLLTPCFLHPSWGCRCEVESGNSNKGQQRERAGAAGERGAVAGHFDVGADTHACANRTYEQPQRAAIKLTREQLWGLLMAE